MTMNIFNGILFLVFAVACMVNVFTVDYDRSLKSKIVVWVCAICAGINFGLAFEQFGVFDGSKQYPSSEYTLKLKTTTVDDQTDTTYVITKIS